MQLHILRGMKAEVITASVAMCIHWRSVEPIMVMSIICCPIVVCSFYLLRCVISLLHCLIQAPDLCFGKEGM
jgi:hypothetical protein